MVRSEIEKVLNFYKKSLCRSLVSEKEEKWKETLLLFGLFS